MDVVNTATENRTIWNSTIPAHLRGRLAGIEMLSWSSGPTLGGAEAGAVAALAGVRAAVVSGGVLCVAGTALLVAVLAGALALYARTRTSGEGELGMAVAGEARQGGLSLALAPAVAEAQALGLPAVVQPLGSMPERVQSGVTGFVAGDEQSFAEHAIALLRDDALWRQQHETALRLQKGLGADEVARRFEALLS